MVYLDNNATTRPADQVVAAMQRCLTSAWANPSSVHRPGQEARRLIELAREQAASLIGGSPKHLTFTSGGTEAIDLAIRGALSAIAPQPPFRPVVTTAIEHAAVRDLFDHLHKSKGLQVRTLPLDPHGVVDLAGAEPLLGKPGEVALASIQWANNETGAIQPIAQLAAMCRERGIVFHCDATQWIGKGPASVAGDQTPDLLTFSPHKFHGPKGVGVLWSRPGARWVPVLHGTQEGGRRGGTENVAGIVGAGVACTLAAAWLADPAERSRLAALRDRFESAVLARCRGAVVNGPRDPARRLWNTTNIGFPSLEAEALLLTMSERGLAASAGAACSSGSLEPSPVLLAMGIPPGVAHGSIRFSLSRESTDAEIDEAVQIVAASVSRVGASSA